MTDRLLTARRWSRPGGAPLFTMAALILGCLLALGCCGNKVLPRKTELPSRRHPPLRLREAMAIAEDVRSREGIPIAWRIECAQRYEYFWAFTYAGDMIVDRERGIVGTRPHASIVVLDDGRTKVMRHE